MNKQMMTIFNGRQDEQENRQRGLYRSRLQELAERSASEAEARKEPASPVVSIDTPTVKAAEPKIAKAEMPAPRADGAGSGADVSEQSRKLGAQISAYFVDGITLMVKELSQQGTEERRKLEESLALMAKISQDLQALRREVSSLSERVDSMSQSERTLSLKVATTDARLREYQDSRQETTGALQSLEKRLGTQAGAIRTLHSALNDLGSRQEDVRTLLKKLDGISGARAAVSALPKDL